MLVPSMTLEEIRKEIDKDFPILYRKSIYIGRKLEKELKPKRDEVYRQVFDYYSKYKNTWIYAFKITKKNNIASFLAYYYGSKGLSGILKLTEGNRLGYLTGHFFQRYNERLNLGLVKPEDKMKAFLPYNITLAIQPMKEIKKGIYTMFAVVSSGTMLGIYDKNLNFFKMNTFITGDMLKGNQVDLYARLNLKLEKYVDTLYDLE